MGRYIYIYIYIYTYHIKAVVREMVLHAAEATEQGQDYGRCVERAGAVTYRVLRESVSDQLIFEWRAEELKKVKDEP